MEFEDFETKECSECHGQKGFYNFYQQCVYPCDTCGGYGYEPDYERPIKKGKTSMNYSTAVMLINEEIRAIACSYEVESEKPAEHQIKARKVFKTLDKTIKKGDFVVVPTNTRHNMTVMKVEDTDVDVDFESDIQVDWAVCKVDRDTVHKNKSKEGEWIAELKKVERKHQKDKLKEKVLGAYNVDGLSVLTFQGQHDASTLTIEAKPVQPDANTNK